MPFQKIHIWVDKGLEDYTWQNELVQELRNSKYSYLFGNYGYWRDWTDINTDYDYIIHIMMTLENRGDHYGCIILYRLKNIDNRTEFLYRTSSIFIYSEKLEWIYSMKNHIIEWIDDGLTSF